MKTKQLNIRVPDDLLATLKVRAVREKKTLALFVIETLRASVTRAKPEPPSPLAGGIESDPKPHRGANDALAKMAAAGPPHKLSARLAGVPTSPNLTKRWSAR